MLSQIRAQLELHYCFQIQTIRKRFVTPFLLKWRFFWILMGIGDDLVELKSKELSITCSEEERKLLEHIRSLSFGEIMIFIQAGKPIRIEVIKKSIKL